MSLKNLVKWWSISSQLIIQEAEKLWMNIDILVPEKNLFYLIDKSWKKVLFKNIDCWLNSAIWFKVVEDKELTYEILQRNDLSCPKSIYVNKFQEIDFDKISIPYPLVVKPVDGGHWDWVSVNIKDKESLITAVNFAFTFSDRVIIQNLIIWEDHRILVVGWKVVAGTKRIPPYVIWDGKLTIKELIEKENENPLRWKWWDHDSPMSKIKMDDIFLAFIKKQSYWVDDVLEKRKQINVRENANLSTWWLAIDITDNIHPDTIEVCIKAAELLWLQVAWVDVLSSDISKPLNQNNWAIIEVNSTPWLRMHYFPAKWIPRNPAMYIVKLAFGIK